MSRLRRFFHLDVLGTALDIAIEQQQVIRAQKRLLALKDAEIAERKLEYVRSTRDLIEHGEVVQPEVVVVRAAHNPP